MVEIGMSQVWMVTMSFYSYAYNILRPMRHSHDVLQAFQYGGSTTTVGTRRRKHRRITGVTAAVDPRNTGSQMKLETTFVITYEVTTEYVKKRTLWSGSVSRHGFPHGGLLYLVSENLLQ